MNRSIGRFLRITSLMALIVMAAPASAQDVAGAAALFKKGLDDMNEGKYETGCKTIAESQRLDPRPGTLFTLATCESKWGHVATAMIHYGDYLSLFEQLSPDQQRRQGDRPKVAMEEQTKLAPEIPELTMSPLPSGAPAGTVVKRGNLVMGEMALGVALPIDPGEYRVSTTTPDGAVWEERITIAKGEKKQVTLQVMVALISPPVVVQPVKTPAAAATNARSQPDVEQDTGTQWAVAIVAGGIGTVGLVIGGVTGALAVGKKGEVDDHCGKGIQSNDETACDRTGLNAAESMSTLGLVSTIGFGVGLVGVGTAVVLLLTGPTDAKPATGAASRWVSVGVLSAGPQGALLGARAAW